MIIYDVDSLGKSLFVLGSELWEDHFDSLLDYVVNIWEVRKINYMVMTHPSHSPQPGIWGDLLGLRGRVVRICVREVSLTLVSFTHLIFIIGMNVCGSAYENGCMVDGTCATAAD